MATLLHLQGKRVGHFSSPHILKFNERIWIDGDDIDNNSLNIAHNRLYSILGRDMSEALSYFEYTTLLALVAMEELDIIILEAGLGGEFDATNVVSKELSVITPIGFDHQEFLGNSIKEIASTKLNSIEKRAIMGFQPYKEVYNIAKNIDADIYFLDREENERVLALTKKLNWSYYLYENTLLALKALDILSLPYNIEDLKYIKLFGRFYPISPNITIDVGHNLLASKAISKALKARYGDKKIVLVYNALKDKDYGAILNILKPHIERVEIIPIDTNRALDISLLEKELDRLSIEFNIFENVNKDDIYLVFGSFFVVESFIKKYLPQI